MNLLSSPINKSSHCISCIVIEWDSSCRLCSIDRGWWQNDLVIGNWSNDEKEPCAPSRIHSTRSENPPNLRYLHLILDRSIAIRSNPIGIAWIKWVVFNRIFALHRSSHLETSDRRSPTSAQFDWKGIQRWANLVFTCHSAIHPVAAQQHASSIRKVSAGLTMKSSDFAWGHRSKRSSHFTSLHLRVAEWIDFPCFLKGLTWGNSRLCAT
jgi:hypothetical protein